MAKAHESTRVDRRRVGLARMWKRLNEDPGAATDDPPSVRYVGVYRVERTLGRGGMGKVYLAHDDRLDRPVAIKQIRGDKARAELHDARLRREARAVARLNHPAIAQVHDVVYDGDGYSIVMEYVEGRNIAQLLARGELHGGLAINVAIQVAQGLATAHDLDMVHRDLKAENVMVTPDGFAKILDFGLVKKLSAEQTRESLSERGLLLGTVVSMSPEQASGRPVDARSDLFSFGVLLYEMFTGYSPFRRERWLESLESIRSDRQASAQTVRPELPAELSHLIDWLLRKEPEKRPKTTRLVVDTLARIAATTSVGELPAPNLGEATGELQESHGSTGTFPARNENPAAVESGSVSRWRGILEPLNVSWISMTALVVITFILMFWRMGTSTDMFRVLVVRPTVEATGAGLEQYDGLRAEVQASTLDVLKALEHLEGVRSSQSLSDWEQVAREARIAGAIEVLHAKLTCEKGGCAALYQRLRTSDRGSSGRSGHFTVDDAEHLEEILTRQLRGLFSDKLAQSPP